MRRIKRRNRSLHYVWRQNQNPDHQDLALRSLLREYCFSLAGRPLPPLNIELPLIYSISPPQCSIALGRSTPSLVLEWWITSSCHWIKGFANCCSSVWSAPRKIATIYLGNSHQLPSSKKKADAVQFSTMCCLCWLTIAMLNKAATLPGSDVKVLLNLSINLVLCIHTIFYIIMFLLIFECFFNIVT